VTANRFRAGALLGFGGVPSFPHTPEGQVDYHDVIRGREMPTERRARERGASGRRR